MDARDAISVQLTDLIDAGSDVDAIDDEHVLAEFEEALSGRNLLMTLKPHPTPVGFSRRVQTRVRRRTGGRFSTQQVDRLVMWSLWKRLSF